MRRIFAQTCIGVWGWIAKHVFLPILYQVKNAQEVLKRNLRPKRLGGSAIEGKCQDCASNVRPNLIGFSCCRNENEFVSRVPSQFAPSTNISQSYYISSVEDTESRIYSLHLGE